MKKEIQTLAANLSIADFCWKLKGVFLSGDAHSEVAVRWRDLVSTHWHNQPSWGEIWQPAFGTSYGSFGEFGSFAVFLDAADQPYIAVLCDVDINPDEKLEVFLKDITTAKAWDSK